MRTEEFFELLLEFGKEWKVKEVESVAQSDEVDIYVEYVGAGKVHDYAPSRRWRHLDIMQYKTFINAALPRLKMSDGSVKTVTPPWADKHERHSHLFEIAVIEVLLVVLGGNFPTESLSAKVYQILGKDKHKIKDGSNRTCG